jgi:tetracycline resistance efflux pump
MEYGFLSVIPPLVTIVLALAIRNVFVALLVGIFLASMTLSPDIFSGINATFYNVVKTFASNGNTIVIMSLLLIGAMLYLIERSGGIEGFVDIMVRKKSIIRSKKAAAFFTWLLGIVIFTSGSLSCMVTGSIARPLNDSMKVSHEKAAFLIHTTSTPWCVLLPLSGWLGAMTGYLTSGGVPDDQAITVLFQSILLNFYCIIAVAFALISCLAPVDFGPMKKAEERASLTGALDDPAHVASSSSQSATKLAPKAKPHLANMIVPIVVMIATIIGVLYVTGSGNLTKGAGMQALLWGSVLSVLSISVMCLAEKVFTLEELTNEVLKGMCTMFGIATILCLAFTLGPLVKQLGTGAYLSSIFMQFLTPSLLPLLTFIIAMILSFATGTSMGTMAIMAVIALPMAIDMGVNIPLTAGAMFGGSIFGDHASPISDTTIMSCATSGCNIMDHIKTQMPYVLGFACVSMVLYVVCGFIM